jgi:hypothetical protein
MPQQGKPGAGDFTGRQKVQQAKEQSEALKERQGEMSMATAVATEEEEYGVFDPRTGARLNEVNPARVALEEPEPEIPAPRFGAPQEPTYSGKEPVETQQPPVSTRRAFTAPPEVARSTMVTIRVEQDIEDMTFGMINGEPNNFNFREGLAYKVPRALAEHLNDRGLVRQWISG